MGNGERQCSGSVPKDSGSVPTVKFLLEGQEESGSDAIAKVAAKMKDRLRADVLLVCDTGAAADLQPAILLHFFYNQSSPSFHRNKSSLFRLFL